MQVLVTGDCGTSDHEALRAGRERGLDVIVIDHHELPAGESAAYALVNSRRPDDTFAFKGLASCGVAFYLAAALRTRLGAAFDPRELLDLVALGTIADLVPLTDENRILVAAGLKTLSARKRPGLAALIERADLTDGTITAHQAAFRLTPRLNAAGRLGEAQLALDLLLASPADAPKLAEAINDQNTERQRIQELVWMEARAQGAAQADAPAVVVGAEGWHQGVVGIVAARLVDELGRPAIAVGFKDGQGRGSARTVPGVNLYEALAACGAHLTKFGGHAGAAGMSLTIDRLDGFRAAFVAEAARQLNGRATAAVEVDAEVALGDLDLPFTEELARLAPFGAANREPLFALRGVTARTHPGRRQEAPAADARPRRGDQRGDRFRVRRERPRPRRRARPGRDRRARHVPGGPPRAPEGDQIRPAAERRLRSAGSVRSRRLIEGWTRYPRPRSEPFGSFCRAEISAARYC